MTHEFNQPSRIGSVIDRLKSVGGVLFLGAIGLPLAVEGGALLHHDIPGVVAEAGAGTGIAGLNITDSGCGAGGFPSLRLDNQRGQAVNATLNNLTTNQSYDLLIGPGISTTGFSRGSTIRTTILEAPGSSDTQTICEAAGTTTTSSTSSSTTSTTIRATTTTSTPVDTTRVPVSITTTTSTVVGGELPVATTTIAPTTTTTIRQLPSGNEVVAGQQPSTPEPATVQTREITGDVPAASINKGSRQNQTAETGTNTRRNVLLALGAIAGGGVLLLLTAGRRRQTA